MAHPTKAIPFSPPADLIANIIDQITDPALSLRTIAAANHTTTEALSLWLSSPEIRQRLELLDSAACTRVRQLANAQLDTVLLTLRSIQQNFHAHQLAGHPSPSPSPSSSASDSDPSHPRSSAASSPPDSEISNFKLQNLNHRIEETARKAGAAIYRLTRLQPAHIQVPSSPPGRGAGAGGAAAVRATSTPALPTSSTDFSPLPHSVSSHEPATPHDPQPLPDPATLDSTHPLATIANLEAFVARLEAEAQAEAQAAAPGETRAEPAAQPQPAAQPNAQRSTHSQPDAAPSIPAAPPPHAPTSLPRNKKKPPHPTQQWRATTSPTQSTIPTSPDNAPRGPWP